MMLIRLIILLLPWLLCAEMLQVSNALMRHQFIDQNGLSHELDKNQKLLISWDKESTALANEYFKEHSALVQSKKAALLVDLSQAPQGIVLLFILPRMRSYAHSVLLSYDETFNRTLPYKEGCITLLQLQEYQIVAIDFVDDIKGLDQIFEQ